MFMCDGGRPRSFEAAAAEELNECGQFMRLDRSLSLSRCKEGRGKEAEAEAVAVVRSIGEEERRGGGAHARG